eukprot:TRINITY_DN25076_c0_g1_i1.p1 TRINITY_DN25076_c0_g1~~TRINITY_DN25076_c0_g1_i1.p1  ORF type:complete len:530 (+),score=252.23 TRINITY_DN25076_c0_g1_i1:142-1731(+)
MDGLTLSIPMVASSAASSPAASPKAGSIVGGRELVAMALVPSPRAKEAAGAACVAARKAAREKEDYDEIFKYMQTQLAYMKRKVIRKEAAMQCDLQLPLDDMDEQALQDMGRLLAEVHAAEASGTNELNMERCLLKSDRLNAVLATVSEQAARMLSHHPVVTPSATPISGSLLGEDSASLSRGPRRSQDMSQRLSSTQQAEELKRLEQDHQIALRQNELKLKALHDAKLEEVVAEIKNEHATKMKKSEQMFSIKLEEVEAEAQRVAAVLKAEVAGLKAKLNDATRAVDVLKEEKLEIQHVVEVKDAMALNFKKDHYTAQSLDHERNAAAMNRTAQATAALVNLLAQKQKDIDELRYTDGSQRLRNAFVARERVMRQTIDDCFAKIEAQQQEYTNLLEIHTAASQSLTTCMAKLAALGDDGGPPPGPATPTRPQASPPPRGTPRRRSTTAARKVSANVAERLAGRIGTDAVAIVPTSRGSVAVVGGGAAKATPIDFSPSVTTVAYSVRNCPTTGPTKPAHGRSPNSTRSI